MWKQHMQVAYLAQNLWIKSVWNLNGFWCFDCPSAGQMGCLVCLDLRCSHPKPQYVWVWCIVYMLVILVGSATDGVDMRDNKRTSENWGLIGQCFVHWGGFPLLIAASLRLWDWKGSCTYLPWEGRWIHTPTLWIATLYLPQLIFKRWPSSS